MKTLVWPSILLAALFVVAFLVSGAGRHYAGEIVFAQAGDIHTLDPAQMTWSQDIRAAMALFEGLMAYDPKTLAPIPGVAASYERSADGLVYTFHLRRDARWSNGDPVTARDFVFAWRRALTPISGCQYVNLYFCIKNAQAYFSGRASADARPVDFSTVGIAAPDDHTLVVTLAAPCTYFLDLVAFPPFYPLHAASMEPFRQPDGSYDPRWTMPPNLVSNGPFVLADWRFKEYLLLEPNADFHDRAAVRCDHLKIVSAEDPNAALLAYNSGQIDVLSFVPQQLAPELLAQEKAGLRHDIHYGPVFGTYYYLFNCQRKPFDDPRVRKAIVLATDRRAIVEHVTRQDQKPIGTLVPPGYIAGYHSPQGLPYDVAQARALLAAAGFPGGKDFPAVDVLYNKESIHETIAQALAQMWQENLGISVRFHGVESKTFSATRRSHDFAICRGGWYGDYMDPTTWLDLFKSGAGNNDARYSSPRFDALLSAAAAEPDPARRFALLHDAEAILCADDLPFIPLFQYADGYIYDPKKIAGADFNVRMLTPLEYIHRVR